MDTKTYIFIYFYQQYLVLFTIVLRNRETFGGVLVHNSAVRELASIAAAGSFD